MCHGRGLGIFMIVKGSDKTDCDQSGDKVGSVEVERYVLSVIIKYRASMTTPTKQWKPLIADDRVTQRVL